eukprot:TRINITY_DN603_c0_g1_i3.p1 TRINITY_DN603_c0_g1~~TRINITY_DN603_c0_g1_i3.p1  ORF type:complete len:408 (+),score=88.34 TRINITY_DN603_c0_g1_i3:219-1442(+)
MSVNQPKQNTTSTTTTATSTVNELSQITKIVQELRATQSRPLSVRGQPSPSIPQPPLSPTGVNFQMPSLSSPLYSPPHTNPSLMRRDDLTQPNISNGNTNSTPARNSKAVLSALSDLQDKIRHLEMERSYYQDFSVDLEKENKTLVSELRLQISHLEHELAAVKEQVSISEAQKQELELRLKEVEMRKDAIEHAHWKVTVRKPKSLSVETPFIPSGVANSKTFSLPANVQKTMALLSSKKSPTKPRSKSPSPPTTHISITPPKTYLTPSRSTHYHSHSHSQFNDSHSYDLQTSPKTPTKSFFSGPSGQELEIVLRSLEEEHSTLNRQCAELLRSASDDLGSKVESSFIISTLREKMQQKKDQINLLRKVYESSVFSAQEEQQPMNANMSKLYEAQKVLHSFQDLNKL